MLRYAIILLGAAALLGCQSSNNPPPNSNQDNMEPSAPSATQPSAATPDEMRAERAAYAARASYPIGEASNDLHLTAMVNRAHQDRIEVINPTDRAVDNAAVWVNGKYVTYVAHIPARTAIRLDRKQFYDNGGHSLAEGNTPADKIQVQVGDRLFNVMGPAFL